MSDANAILLRESDYGFWGYPDRATVLPTVRAYHVHTTLPELRVERNVTFLPSRPVPWDGVAGSLYDEQGRRIDLANVRRYHLRQNLSVDPEVLPADFLGAEQVNRRVLYLGHWFWHYGHFLLETMNRWWPLRGHAGQFDSWLIHLPSRHWLNLPHFRHFMALAGLTPERMLPFDKPLRVAEVLIPQASFEMHDHAYEEFGRFTRSLSEQQARSTPSDQPLYLSRSHITTGVRRYRQEPLLESRLAARGVRIFHPQEHTPAEQLRAINSHTRIIGPIGSGLHTAVFAQQPLRIAHLTPLEVPASYLLVNRCMGHESHYFYSAMGVGRARLWLDETRDGMRQGMLGKGWGSQLRQRLLSKGLPFAPFLIETRMNIDALIVELERRDFLS